LVGCPSRVRGFKVNSPKLRRPRPFSFNTNVHNAHWLVGHHSGAKSNSSRTSPASCFRRTRFAVALTVLLVSVPKPASKPSFRWSYNSTATGSTPHLAFRFTPSHDRHSTYLHVSVRIEYLHDPCVRVMAPRQHRGEQTCDRGLQGRWDGKG
jgi:hypothetical protein